MNYILSDGAYREALFPFTLTRPISDIRIGILTIMEKWEKWLGMAVSVQAEEYLAQKFPINVSDENVVINASFLPNANLLSSVKNLKVGEALVYKEEVVAYATQAALDSFEVSKYEQINFKGEILTIKNPWDIFSKNGEALEEDFRLLTKGRKSQPIPDTNTVINPENIFVEEGAEISCSILNASTGPIYIGKNTLIMEGCSVRGSMALCEGGILKMGAKVYGPSTFGPHCRVGGEVNNSVLFAYSNKGHEGYLGNSVLGEWCNLGADTNISNLKNNYAPVRLWSYQTGRFAETGLQFCGLMMGDHSKSGINTMFNTGTVVGVSANIFGSGFPRNFVPSFSWGGASGFTRYLPKKAYEAAEAMMVRRNRSFDETEQAIFDHVFELTQKWRKY